MLKLLVSILLVCIVGQVYAQNKSAKKDIDVLYKLMTGNFSSKKQAEKDTSFKNITLHIKPIWTNKKNEYWLYAEQTLTTAADKTVQQVVYQLMQNTDSTYSAKIYTIKNAEKYVGEYKKKNPLAEVTVADLEGSNSCMLSLKKIGDKKFIGASVDNSCRSHTDGIAYTTSEIKITKEKVVSWDKGFDINNKQVAGSIKSAYVFKRLKK